VVLREILCFILPAMSSIDNGHVVERPLSGASLWGLLGGAAAMVLLFHLYSALAVFSLLLLVGGEFVLVMVAMRFGLAVPVVRAMSRHLVLLSLFLRSLWLRKPTEYQVCLQPEEAPRLFALVRRLCERAEVAPPRAVWLGMDVNAWVRLRGYRRGAGTTVLGIGYDLLAGLSEAEVGAVLAHEMAHAKLVRRGLQWWLRAGLNRAVRLATGLATAVETARQSGDPDEIAEAFLGGVDRLARSLVRLVAACSRQDEFAADQRGAELAGAGPARSALRRLDAVCRRAARLPWHERVAQLEAKEGFSQWLVRELSAGAEAPSAELAEQPFDKYSTHPSLKERLAALPAADEAEPGESPPAIGLLAEPDRVVERLMTTVQRLVAREEEREGKTLDRLSRGGRLTSAPRPLQALGIVVVAFGAIVGASVWVANGFSTGLMVFLAGTIVSGALCHHFAYQRERLLLPVPDFPLLKAAGQSQPNDLAARAQAIESELRGKVAAAKSEGERTRRLTAEAYAALGQCDYLRAHLAANLCLGSKSASVDTWLALAVAAAALGATP